MNYCFAWFRAFLAKHAVEIFKYATRFDYPDLADETALLCSRSPVCNVIVKLPSHAWFPWVGHIFYARTISITLIPPLCSSKTLYRKCWDAVFDTIIHNLQRRYIDIPVSKRTKLCTESGRICRNCHISSIAWVDWLRRINSLQEMENALLSTTNHKTSGNPTEMGCWKNTPLCASCSLWCHSLSDIKLMCRNGVQVMRRFPFSKFLKSASPKKDIFIPAMNAVARQSDSLIRHSRLFSLVFSASSSSWLSDHTTILSVKESSLVISRRSAGHLRPKQDGSIPTHPLCEYTYILQLLHISNPTNMTYSQ